MATQKKAKIDVRSFQPSWRDEYGFVFQKDRAVCTFCLENVMCRTSSVKRHFETKHEKSFKDQGDKTQLDRAGLMDSEKPTSTLHVFARRKNNDTEASYQIANCIAKRGKPFTDGEYIKDAFLSCSEVLFDGLPNKETIMSRIKDIPMSARTVQRRIEEMAENVSEQKQLD